VISIDPTVVFIPMVLLAFAALLLHRRQTRSIDPGDSWWRSPRRRAAAAEAHPYFGTMLIMLAVAAPFPALMLLRGGSARDAVVIGAQVAGIGTGLIWVYVWFSRRSGGQR
jgi:hypothetical protein